MLQVSLFYIKDIVQDKLYKNSGKFQLFCADMVTDRKLVILVACRVLGNNCFNTGAYKCAENL